MKNIKNKDIIWWVQAECLIGLLNLYNYTNDEKYLDIEKKTTNIISNTTKIIKENMFKKADVDYVVGDMINHTDYGNGNATVNNVYYDGGNIKVPSTPPTGIKIPFGKVFGGFKVLFNGIGDIIGGIGDIVGKIFRPGSLILIQPGIKLEAVWVNELNINLYGENGQLITNTKVGQGFDYTLPQAPELEDKAFLYWQDSLDSNKRYYENQEIEVNSNMELKPIYKNTKVVNVYLDSTTPKHFPDFSSALN